MEDSGVATHSDSSNCEHFEGNSDDPPNKKARKMCKRPVEKGTEEYLKKRARNNEAVRKSRHKSKKKIEETQQRVDLLTNENSALKTKVTLLTKELNVLRSLFSNGGITPPSTDSDGIVEIKTEGNEVTVKTEARKHDEEEDDS